MSALSLPNFKNNTQKKKGGGGFESDLATKYHLVANTLPIVSYARRVSYLNHILPQARILNVRSFLSYRQGLLDRADFRCLDVFSVIFRTREDAFVCNLLMVLFLRRL
jgi:hypothetical protein